VVSQILNRGARAIYSLRSPRTCIRGAGCLSCTVSYEGIKSGFATGFRRHAKWVWGENEWGLLLLPSPILGGVPGAHPKPRLVLVRICASGVMSVQVS
jgi:hypothetical protein